uniref:SH2 domain-containing protein n=1 Tax=Arcella intermedia TaxID=1963864 RepID=A0A6B2L4B0_9EUKA
MRIRLRAKDCYAKQYPMEEFKKLIGGTDPYDFLLNESRKLSQCTHLNLAEFHGVCLDKNLMIVREYFPNGSLEDILFPKDNKKKYKLSFWRKMNIAQCVASTLEYVFKEKFTNPNLKFSNILFNQMWDVKLADQDYLCLKPQSTAPTQSALLHDYGKFLVSLFTETYIPSDISDTDLRELVPQQYPSKLRSLINECLTQTTITTFAQVVSSNGVVFDDIFFEASVDSAEICASLWESLTEDHENTNGLPWDVFLPAFCSLIALPFEKEKANNLEFLCLKEMFDVPKNADLVTISSFERVIKCIGPFLEGTEIVHQVKALLEMTWFAGNLTATEAEHQLQSLPNKTFIVRFSGNTGEYSISFKQNNQVLHSRVPVNAKYNLHQYVKLIEHRKKFIPPAQSRYKLGSAPSIFPYCFIR